MLSLLIRRLYKYTLKLKFVMPEHRVAGLRRTKCVAGSTHMWKRRDMSWGRPHIIGAESVLLLRLHPHPHLGITALVNAIFIDGNPLCRSLSANVRARLAWAGQLLKVKVRKW